ncbi:Catalase mono-functional hem-containing protein [Dioscorea alata]|uniref:Catalase mono-functional hem-containing protein n=1 Tax=Dioscorea alata TaxID=55571 RepID=A0ACB7VIM0_DIOAL|nr:Catalase mono-functional hem-containing protein [Dioscorea alata]
MRTNKQIEDQFLKLHPCLPIETRIAIIGAGPSGLSAAYALAKLGYLNVTIFEKYHAVAGMCESVDIEGRIYDLGGQVTAANSAPTISYLAEELGIEFEEMGSHKLALIDSQTGNYQNMEVADDYVSIMPLTLKLQDEASKSGCIGVHAVSEAASDPTLDFLKLHGLPFVPKSVAYGYTSSGYGFVQDMPYAYVQEFTRTSMAGKIRRIKGGYKSMWQKLSDSLPYEVLCNTEVLKICRNDNGAHVTIQNTAGEQKVLEFDKIIISGALPFKNGRIYRGPETVATLESEVLELNDLERELFGVVRTIDYYTTVLKIKGLGHLPIGFYYFAEFLEDPATIGHPVAMQRFYEDTDIFLFWSYGNSGHIRGTTVAKNVVDVVKTMGGVVEKVVLQRRFKYFPHVTSEVVKSGFYEKLECELQGFQNTYYVGGLMAFELTERNSSYAIAMVCKHFTTDNAMPIFPYVKGLFPLVSSQKAQFHRELGELPGIEFPELPTLDSYLKFWGTHSITENKMLYSWINEEGQVVSQRSYCELHANASVIAHNLITCMKPALKPGDRVLLVHPPGLEFIDAFFGCIRAKLIPVPVLPPDPFQRGGQALLKIENISKACNAVAILSTSSYHAAVRAGFVKQWVTLSKSTPNSSAHWPDLPWIHTDSWVKNCNLLDFSGRDVVYSEPKPDDLCFLQFTSGSTGDAKGVMITHDGLINNIKTMRKRYKSTSNTILVSWLPQYHDMGLIGGLFTALVSGGTAILFSPMTFIKNPLLWLQTMSKYKATHSAGPNFAFELVIRRLEANKNSAQAFDLSSMIFLMVAAEPVRQKTIKRFIELCHPFGLSQEVMAPGYGLAENCVFVSCAFGEGKPVFVDWQGRICCGYVDSNDADVKIHIVDPETGREHTEEGKEGEIWISSSSAGIGYWGKQELTQKTFYNKLEGHPGKRFTRTGDLGRVIDRKLFITGRIKDLIIVAGRNIYPADLEKTVENASELLRPGCCAVIGVPEEVLSAKGISVPEASDQVGVLVIAELREGKTVDEEIVDNIKTRVAEEHGVNVASVKLIKPKTICKTSSGKIQRIECLKQFVEGSLSLATEAKSARRKPLLRSLTTGTADGQRQKSVSLLGKSTSLLQSGKGIDDIIMFLKGLVSEQTGIHIDKIDAVDSLVSYGIDSIGVVRAAQKLSDFLGVPVGAVDVFSASCISDLAKFSMDLLSKSQPQSTSISTCVLENNSDLLHIGMEGSRFGQIGIALLQLLALIYVSFLLILPAYLSSLTSNNLLSLTSSEKAGPFQFLLSLILAPLTWIFYIIFTCFSISLFGNSFLQPNYVLTPEVSIWSLDFVKWWALSKAQEIAGKVLAVHLRGTVFLRYWFEMLGARIGSSVLLDTVDITDPSLVSIGEGAVIAEGVLIQSHEVRNEVLSFLPILIGRNASISPYAVIQKGSILGEDAVVPPLQKTEGGKPVLKSGKSLDAPKVKVQVVSNKHLSRELLPIFHFLGIYTVGFLSSLAGAILYLLYISLTKSSLRLDYFAFVCIAGAFHWLPAVITAYATFIGSIKCHPVPFAFFVTIAYLGHGIILSILSSIVKILLGNSKTKHTHWTLWLSNRITIACHHRFAKLLSGTEAFCIYLRMMGAKVGRHCSIRAINPVTNPELISIGDGVHLGDFSRIVPGSYSSCGFDCAKIEVHENSVIGSQSLLLSGSIIQEGVILGALSIAPMDSVLQKGGVYVGAQTPTMVKNHLHALDERIEEMDMKYKRIVGNLAGNLAITTMKVKSRYFHRIGVSGKGVLKMYQDLPRLPKHKVFHAGKSFPVIIRHSNSLSADDDARIDARGASIRILLDKGNEQQTLLDLTLKSGKAFYARTIEDFANWLVCGLPAREQQVKRAPHIREAVWGSLRNTNSFTELHYYSNICRLLRFDDGQEMYVKFKIRPFDYHIGEDSGQVEPKGILPPETGAIPREENDKRPLLFLADDFQTRVNSPNHVRYIFQLQLRPVPSNEAECEVALDCTKPWDETMFPYLDVGEITIDQNLTAEDSEKLEFNPFYRCHEVDVIRATSSSQSASIDHGRSLIYEICQYLRNGHPLPGSWRSFIEQSDAKVDLSGCPMAAPVAANNGGVTLARPWYKTLWAATLQPLLQIFMPYFTLGLIIYAPLQWMMLLKEEKKLMLHWLMPFFYVISGIMASLFCAFAKWVLVGRKLEGDTVMLWSWRVFMDTVWQALRTVTGDYFMEMTCGSFLFGVWMRLMGSKVEQGVYVDSMAAVLNPEMLEIEKGGAVGRDAVLFGHIYEGEGGKVKYGKVKICEGGFVGSRAVAMPGVVVDIGGTLSSLSLAMKDEIVKSS